MKIQIKLVKRLLKERVIWSIGRCRFRIRWMGGWSNCGHWARRVQQ